MFGEQISLGRKPRVQGGTTACHGAPSLGSPDSFSAAKRLMELSKVYQHIEYSSHHFSKPDFSPNPLRMCWLCIEQNPCCYLTQQLYRTANTCTIPTSPVLTPAHQTMRQQQGSPFPQTNVPLRSLSSLQTT